MQCTELNEPETNLCVFSLRQTAPRLDIQISVIILLNDCIFFEVSLIGS